MTYFEAIRKRGSSWHWEWLTKWTGTTAGCSPQLFPVALGGFGPFSIRIDGSWAVAWLRDVTAVETQTSSKNTFILSSYFWVGPRYCDGGYIHARPTNLHKLWLLCLQLFHSDHFCQCFYTDCHCGHSLKLSLRWSSFEICVASYRMRKRSKINMNWNIQNIHECGRNCYIEFIGNKSISIKYSCIYTPIP